ncbi:hypothetical protein BU15DRAFT_69065 [Melanogaster broomeanus]|nr:hypothetical protein BU15DRAFT_69065 [Melanogaster broomeanus]
MDIAARIMARDLDRLSRIMNIIGKPMDQHSAPTQIPVGTATLGHIMNIIDEPMDEHATPTCKGVSASFVTATPIFLMNSNPIGTATLGHTMNVIGKPIDERSPIKGVKLCPVHTNPPPFVDQSTTAEVLEPGIKVVDLLAPYARGGKIGLFGDEWGMRIESALAVRRVKSTTAEVLEPGIKVVDLLAPYAHGGKIGLFGGEWDMRIESVLVVSLLCHCYSNFLMRSNPCWYATLGCIMNVIGEHGPIKGVQLCPIHADPPPFVDQSTTAEVLKTGIKVVDLLAPYAHGGKISFFGGAGVSKTVLIQELITT